MLSFSVPVMYMYSHFKYRVYENFKENSGAKELNTARWRTPECELLQLKFVFYPKTSSGVGPDTR